MAEVIGERREQEQKDAWARTIYIARRFAPLQRNGKPISFEQELEMLFDSTKSEKTTARDAEEKAKEIERAFESGQQIINPYEEIR